MGSYRNASRYRSYHKRSYGRDRALEHIREAEQLSRELGGTDEDVKKYFFSLDGYQLKIILDKYEIKYGTRARDYAEKTISKWKSKKVHMSGMVAERLFSLLPPNMPIESKFKLVESLWNHVGPSSNKIFYIGLEVDLEEVKQIVKNHLENVVIKYEIPSFMESRFNWLAHGDVSVKQQLLNYFRQKETEILSEALEIQLPILMNHLKNSEDFLTNRAKQVLRVGKHEVRIEFNENVKGISENAPTKQENKKELIGCIIFAVLIALYLFLLSLGRSN